MHRFIFDMRDPPLDENDEDAQTIKSSVGQSSIQDPDCHAMKPAGKLLEGQRQSVITLYSSQLMEVHEVDTESLDEFIKEQLASNMVETTFAP